MKRAATAGTLNYSRPTKSSKIPPQRPQSDPGHSDSLFIQLAGLPPQVTADDVTTFLSDSGVGKICDEDAVSLAFSLDGLAFVQLQDLAKRDAALAKNGSKQNQCFINVSICDSSLFEEAKAMRSDFPDPAARDVLCISGCSATATFEDVSAFLSGYGVTEKDSVKFARRLDGKKTGTYGEYM